MGKYLVALQGLAKMRALSDAGFAQAERLHRRDLVAFCDYVVHLASRVGDRLEEHLVELSPSTGSDLGAARHNG